MNINLLRFAQFIWLILVVRLYSDPPEGGPGEVKEAKYSPVAMWILPFIWYILVIRLYVYPPEDGSGEVKHAKCSPADM
jgi:hypothetical protein